MKKKILLSIPILLSVSAAIAVPVALTSQNIKNYQAVTRTGALNDGQDFNVFNTSSLKVEDGIAKFSAKGIRTEESRLNLVSLADAAQFEDIDYDLSFDSNQNIFILKISYLNEYGQLKQENITGNAIIRDNGELDVRFVTEDNEVRYASELKSTASFQNVGFFSWLWGKIKNAAQTVYQVVIRPVVTVVAKIGEFAWDAISQIYYIPLNLKNYINAAVGFQKNWEYQYSLPSNNPQDYVANINGNYAKLPNGKQIKIGINPNMSAVKKEAARWAIDRLNTIRNNDGSYLIPNSLSYYETLAMTSILSWGVTNIANVPDYSISNFTGAPIALQIGLNIATKKSYDGIALSGVGYGGAIDKSHILIKSDSADLKYLKNLMLHELGHMLGLRDLSNVTDETLMSYPFGEKYNGSSPDREIKTDLQIKDIKNLNWLYNGKYQN